MYEKGERRNRVQRSVLKKPEGGNRKVTGRL